MKTNSRGEPTGSGSWRPCCWEQAGG